MKFEKNAFKLNYILNLQWFDNKGHFDGRT